MDKNSIKIPLPLFLLTLQVIFCLLFLSVRAMAQQAQDSPTSGSMSPSVSSSISRLPSQPPPSYTFSTEDYTPSTKDRVQTEVQNLLRSQSGKDPSGIELFFQSQTREHLKQFGYSIFQSATMNFTPPTKTPVSSNYMIGPGDELFIYLWGLVEDSFHVIVDQNGKIVLPKVGVLYVSGLSLPELKEFLFKQVSRFYTGFKLDVSIGKLRSIQVIVAGEVQNPGTYLLSPLSTIYHALFQCGGPTKTGTLRTIKRIKQNQTTDQIDLYHFLLNGDRSQDKPLEDGDTIFVPPVGPVTAIVGPVKRPGIYEQKDLSTVEQLIAQAGGTFLGGGWGVPEIERIRPANEKTPLSTPLSLDAPLKDGDLIRLDLDMVTLSGEVKHPGKFIIKKGERLSSVLIRAGEATEFAYLRGAFFTRLSIREIQQERLNRYVLDLQREILLLSSKDNAESVSPADKRIEKSMDIENKLLDQIKKSQATGRVIVELGSPGKLRGSAADIELEDGDTLYIPRRPGTVTILGEVYNPTSLIYAPGQMAEYYLQKVGGLTANADRKNIYIIKADGSIIGKNYMDRFNLSWDADKKSFVSQQAAYVCLEPGDAIIVPPQLKAMALKKNMMDWSQIFYQTALGAGVIISAY